jgi:cytidylate kinase
MMPGTSEVPVLTLDGPGGAGKGTVALRVARQLGWHYLDSGAIYRVLALLAERSAVALDDASGLASLASDLALTFENGRACLDGEDVDDWIRGETMGNLASRVAALPAVREALLIWQRSRARAPGLVADGRDMGTVVFPAACCKIFLTASAQVRAERRFNQLRQKGFDVTIRRLFEEIEERDRRDANRAVSPLRPADDAVFLDTTEMTIEAVVAEVLQRVRQVLVSR